MPNLQTPSLDDLLELSRNALIANTSTPITLVPGDPILALLEAASISDLVLIAAIQAAVRLMRASTCSGSDLDDWFYDFGYTRFAGATASGDITVVTTGALTIDVGHSVLSGSGTAIYEVVAAPTGWAHDAGISYAANTYTITGAGTYHIPVAATVAGTGQNVSAASLNSFSPPVAGVSSISNELAILNGKDADDDAAARSGFRTFIQSLGKATESAILGAVQGVLGAEADVVLIEGQNLEGTLAPSHFVVYAENGSGSLSSDEVTDITIAVEAVRGFGVSFEVKSPADLAGGGVDAVTVAITVVFDAAYASAHAATADTLTQVLTQYVNTLPIQDLSKQNGSIRCALLIDQIQRLAPQYPAIRYVESVVITGSAGSYGLPPTTVPATTLAGADYPTPAKHIIRDSTVTITYNSVNFAQPR
jgi:hypothetical protein